MEPRKSIRNVDNSSGRRKINTFELVDRISALPDFILGVILSLLPTKNTVATSTLSKRWKFLWRTVHNLDFYLDVHDLTKEQVEDENNKFIGFVNHVLLHHDAGVLNKFRLEWTPACIQSHVTSWIKTAITRNVHELSLALDYDYDGEFDMPISVSDGEFDMPISIFSCDSLLSLLLNGWICLYAPTVFCLPKLERLDLDGVNFQSNEAFENIIRGCPVLNYLHIKYVEDDDFRYIISSTSLRCLKLNVGNHKYLQLEASSLEHLELCGLISVNFVQKKLTSVVKADLDYEDLFEDLYQAGICNSMVDEVSALDCVRILTLSDDVMRALSWGTMDLSTKFERLVKLETSIKCCHWSPLLDLIQRSNNLEVLTINKLRMDRDPGDNFNYSDWTTPVKVPRCLSTSLKKVVLNGYYGDEDEREMIRYMLNHGSALEVMQISCHRRKKHNKYELLQEISEFPRKSPACKVKFFEQVKAL